MTARERCRGRGLHGHAVQDEEDDSDDSDDDGDDGDDSDDSGEAVTWS